MKKNTSIFAKLGQFLRGEVEKLKPMTAKQRWEYYKMYYLIPTVVTVFVGTIVIAGIVTGIVNNQNENMLYVQLVGSTLEDYSGWVETYQQDRGYTDTQFLKLSQGQYYADSMYYATTASVVAATDSLDVLICEDDNLTAILKMGMGGELSDDFTSEFLNEKLCYTEFTVVNELDGPEETVSGYYYVDVTGTPLAKVLGIEGNAYLLKCVTSQRHEEVEAFFQYVLTQQ